MKNLTVLLLIVLMGFTACEGPMGPMGPEGPEGPPGPVNIRYITYDVNESDWVLFGKPNMPGSYFIYEFPEPFLSSSIYEYGTMVGYMFYYEINNEYQTVLPFTYYDMEITDGGAEFPYSVQYMCDFAPKQVSFKVVYSDFYTVDYRPPSITFKVMYIW